jgi:multiple antibiotic resistance protein
MQSGPIRACRMRSDLDRILFPYLRFEREPAWNRFSTFVSDRVNLTHMINKFWLAFLPIFMAVNAIGLLPMFINFTINLEKKQIQKIIIQSVITATAVSIVFLAAGKAILDILGVTTADFLIAGGALLFVISLDDLLSMEKKSQQIDLESLGAVPLGVPLIVGPAVLTTILLLVPQYGATITILAIIANILISGLMFWLSAPIISVLGNSGAKTISKIGDLLLAAISIMMIRKGIVMILTQFKDVL